MGSILCNATGEHVSRAASLPLSSAVSMATWFKITGTVADYREVIRFGTTFSSRYVLSCSSTYSGFSFEHPGGQATPASNDVSTAAWYYAAFAVSGISAGNASFYLWDAAGAVVCSGTGDGGSFTPSNMYIGGGNTTTRFVDGLVAHGRAWDAALSQSDFEAEMASATVVRTANFNSGFTDYSTLGISPEAARTWTVGGTASSDADEPSLNFGAPTPIVMTWAL